MIPDLLKPYVAVIRDSFHAALSSRILWIAFVAIWIFLAALAPIGYHEDYTTTFRWIDLDNGTQMKAMLARGLVDPKEENTALGRIAQTFPTSIQRKLRQVAEGEDVGIDKRELADSLNASLEDEWWYDAQAWKSTVRLRELRELDDMGESEITETQRKRRARLRIEAALPGVFAAQSARSITLSYAGFDFPAIFAIGKPQFVSLINQFVVPVMMDWLLGFALIFLGILVTASIVPDMLQPGSLHLLLSKPVSRTMLLLSKFIGGCAFVFLCVCQLVIGLWLIAGIRLDIWNVRLLWCIPVAVFLFAVFFSVSVLAGLRWRSPILSIGVTCMFGAFVLVVGFIGGYFDGFVRGPDRINRMAFDDDAIVITTRGKELRYLDTETNQWTDLIESDFRQRDLIVPPVRIAPGRIATARIRNGQFSLYGSGSLDLLLLDGDDNWQPDPGIRLPNGTRRMFSLGDNLVTLNNAGIMMTATSRAIEESADRSDDDEEQSDADQDAEDPETTPMDPSKIGVTGWIKDLLRMQGGATEDFREIMPPELTLTEPVNVVPVGGTGDLAIYTRGRLVRLAMPTSEGVAASIGADQMLDGDDAARTILAATDQSVLLWRQDETIRWLDGQSLEQVAEIEAPEGQTMIAAVGCGSVNRFAYLTSDGVLFEVLRVDDGIETRQLPISEAVAIAFHAQRNQLAVAHHIDSIDFFDVVAGEPLSTRPARSIRPRLESWRNVDRLVITPLRTLTPQTGELSQTVTALISGKSSFAFGSTQNEQPQEIIRLRVARPVLSCSAFIIVVMAISCIYFKRRDF